MEHKEALIIVDYQNGFVDRETNELYVEGGEQISSVINQLMKEVKSKGGIVLASKDMHRLGNISFAANYLGKKSVTLVGPNDPRSSITLEEVMSWNEGNHGLAQSAGFGVEELKKYLITIGGKMILWPRHCVVNTSGSEYYKDLDVHNIDIEICKGYAQDQHPYSAFPGIEVGTTQNLEAILETQNVKKIQVVGLATDYCVKDTVLDLLDTKKFEVELILSGCRAVSEQTNQEAIFLMQKMGAKILP